MKFWERNGIFNGTESVTFQTERVFLENHPTLSSNWDCWDDETETWLGRSNRLCIRFPFGCRCSWRWTFLSWNHCPSPPLNLFRWSGSTGKGATDISEASPSWYSCTYYSKKLVMIGVCTYSMYLKCNYLYGFPALQFIVARLRSHI